MGSERRRLCQRRSARHKKGGERIRGTERKPIARDSARPLHRNCATLRNRTGMRRRYSTRIPTIPLPRRSRGRRFLRRLGQRARGTCGALGLALVAQLTLCSCAEPRVSLASGPREYVPSDYPQVLKKWTRNESLIVLSELADELNVTATYESWDFRWAYVVRYAADYRLTIDQRRGLLDRTLHETADDHEFYVALYGTNWRWLDLSHATSAWIVRLIDDQGSETAPARIESIARPGPLEFRYFPFTTVWRRAFRIRFPRQTADGRPTIAPGAQWFGLRFAGAAGNEELRWDIDSSSSRSESQGSGGT